MGRPRSAPSRLDRTQGSVKSHLWLHATGGTFSVLLTMNMLGASMHKQVLAALLFSLCSAVQETKADPTDYDLYEISTTQTTPAESVSVNLDRTNYIYWQAGNNVTFAGFGTLQVTNPEALRDHLEASSHWVSVANSGRIKGWGWGFINLRYCTTYHHFDDPSKADEISLGGGALGAQTLDKDKVKQEFGLP
jgi:hypothetical protein